MAFKRIEAAQERWRAVNAPHLVALVRAFDELYGAKWPKATAKITDDVEERWPSTTTRPSTGST